MELLPFPVLASWIHGTWLREKLYHMLDTNSEHILPSGEPRPSPAGYCHLIGAITVSLKGHLILLSDQLLEDGGDTVRAVDSMTVGPLLRVSICEASSLFRSDTV